MEHCPLAVPGRILADQGRPGSTGNPGQSPQPGHHREDEAVSPFREKKFIKFAVIGTGRAAQTEPPCQVLGSRTFAGQLIDMVFLK